MSRSPTGIRAGCSVQDNVQRLNAAPNCTPTPSFSLSATCMPTNGRPLQRYSFFLNVGNDFLDLRQATLAGDVGQALRRPRGGQHLRRRGR